MAKPIRDRLDDCWELEPRSGCWLWTRAKQSAGYGHFASTDGHALAHRAIYERERGRLPIDKFLCHKCDNPGCVNPDHMFIGSHVENMADMRAKGRSNKNVDRKGVRNGRARFSEDQVRDMHNLRRDGWTTKEIARYFGAPDSTIHSALNVHWAHLREEVTLG